jgi:hypothetical protein
MPWLFRIAVAKSNSQVADWKWKRLMVPRELNAEYR